MSVQEGTGGYAALYHVLKVLFSLDQYIDELEVIGTNQPQHSSKFDMMSIVQEEEEESEMLEETTSERSASKISLLCFIHFLLFYLAVFGWILLLLRHL